MPHKTRIALVYNEKFSKDADEIFDEFRKLGFDVLQVMHSAGDILQNRTCLCTEEPYLTILFIDCDESLCDFSISYCDTHRDDAVNRVFLVVVEVVDPNIAKHPLFKYSLKANDANAKFPYGSKEKIQQACESIGNRIFNLYRMDNDIDAQLS